MKLYLLKKILQKHNEKVLLKKDFIRCANCKKIIYKEDKYCQYCGAPTEKALS